ncbi:MAG: carbohydrate ABC transporter permease [Spirochaetaceae bacterium]
MDKIMKRPMDEKIFVAFCSVIMVLFAAACVYPLLVILGGSFTDEMTLLREGYKIIPEKFSIDGYLFVLSGNNSMLDAYMVSLVVTLGGTAIALFASTLAAYSLSRHEFKLRKYFNFFVVFTLLFNAGLVPWYMVCVQVLHIKGTIWALILPMAANGFNIMLLRNFLSQIPNELFDAARIDGASEVHILVKIVVPMSIPAIATVGLFYAMGYWNDWWLALLYLDNKPQLYPVQYMLRVMVTNAQFLTQNASQITSLGSNTLPSETLKLAATMMAIGPLIIVYPFIQKFFSKGISLGAVKG